MSRPFRFRNFTIYQKYSPFKVTSDAVLFGSWICLPRPEGYLMDLGTGTGLLACLMKIRYPSVQTFGIESDSKSCVDARENFRSVGIPETHLAETDFMQSWPTEWPQLWDYLIANPPFFIDDLPNRIASLAKARHFTAQEAESFITQLSVKLKPEGRLYLMLPQRYFEWYRTALSAQGLYLQRICHVRGTARKSVHLVLTEFGRHFLPTFQIEFLAMYETNGIPTEAYRHLVKDYYEAGYFERFYPSVDKARKAAHRIS